MDATFTANLAHPFYGDHVLYHVYNLRPGFPTLRAMGVQWMAQGEHVVANRVLHPRRAVG